VRAWGINLLKAAPGGGRRATFLVLQYVMSDAELVKRWRITETLLERARRALPGASAHDEQKCAALLARYREFLDDNELELALDTIFLRSWVI
jgi:hypothetical protein